MYEWITLTPHAHYISCPAKIGILTNDRGEAYLLDSGNDKDAGKKVKRMLAERDLTLRAVYHTHSHADHIGGSAYLQRETGCAVYAPDAECAFVRYPILEPTFLYGGDPMRELRHKFLMAEACDARPLTEAALPEGVEVLSLTGHSFGMVGFRTSEGIVYLGDALVGAHTLQKYPVQFLVDVADHLQTLEKLRTMDGKLFVPSHADATEHIAPLAEQNIASVLAVGETLAELCRTPQTQESLLQAVFAHYEMQMTVEQYALVGSTVRSYLTWLKENGRIRLFAEDHCLLWEKCK